MFLNAKKKQEFYQRLENKLQTLEEHMTAVTNQSGSLNQALTRLQQIDSLTHSISQNLDGLQAAVQKHDMAIEDLLDEWEEKKSDEDSVQECFREAEQTEKSLLELFEAYEEQFFALKHFADTKDDAWASQIALMEKNLEHYRRSCGITMIQDCSTAVDYDLHEVIEVVDTASPALDKTVASVYRPGYCYKGKVKKKAQVSAYRTVI